jgi:3-dehydroquinate synthase class II
VIDLGSHSEAHAEGEALVFHPDGRGKVSLVGRMKIEDWSRLTAAH